MSESNGFAAAYRAAEESNVERAGECPRCGTAMERRHHRWVDGAYDEDYPQIRCDCGNHYEPDFGWREGTVRHHKVVVYPDGDGYRAKFFDGEHDRTPYIRENLATVAVFGDDPDLTDRTAYKRVGVVFADAETLRLYV